MGFDVVIPDGPLRVMVGELAEEEEAATRMSPDSFIVAEDVW